MTHSVYISPKTIDLPRYATLAAMDAWCNAHAPGRWCHHRAPGHYVIDGIRLCAIDYNTYVFEDKDVAALFKLTWWKPDV